MSGFTRINLLAHLQIRVCARMCKHTPVQRVLQYVDRHDDAGVPPAVQGEDGEVGGEKVCGLLCVCCCSCSTATRDGEKATECVGVFF